MNRLNRLDHMRFFACLWVVFRHFRSWGLADNVVNYHPDFFIRYISSIFMNGQIGVDVFFVLSAFLFTIIIKDRDVVYRKFIYNRVLRIFPLFFLCVLIVIASKSVSIVNIFIELLTFSYKTIANLSIDMFIIWTIGMEFKFYFLLPVILLIIKKQNNKYITLLGLILIINILKFLFSSIYHEKSYWLLYLSLLGRLDQFLIGILMGKMYLDNKFSFLKNTITANTCLFLFVLILSLYTYMVNSGGFYNNIVGSFLSFFIQAIICACIIISYLYSNLFSDKITNKVFIWLGSLTYSIYLFHTIIGNTALKYFHFNKGPYGSFLNVLFIVLPMTILFAFLTKHVIEKPFLNMKVNYFSDNFIKK